jgi:hypothetical protein
MGVLDGSRVAFFEVRGSGRLTFWGALPLSAFTLGRSASIRLTTFERVGVFGASIFSPLAFFSISSLTGPRTRPGKLLG